MLHTFHTLAGLAEQQRIACTERRSLTQVTEVGDGVAQDDALKLRPQRGHLLITRRIPHQSHNRLQARTKRAGECR